MDISGPEVSVRGNSLSMCREPFSSRVRNNFCSSATTRDKFFENRVVQTWNSFLGLGIDLKYIDEFRLFSNRIKFLESI